MTNASQPSASLPEIPAQPSIDPAASDADGGVPPSTSQEATESVVDPMTGAPVTSMLPPPDEGPPAFFNPGKMLLDADTVHEAAMSQRIDRMWQRVGGYNLEAFQALALWAMRNRNQNMGAGRATLAMASAAFIYGDLQLSRDLVQEYEVTRVLYAPHGVDTLTRSPAGEIRPDVAKLLSMLERNSQ